MNMIPEHGQTDRGFGEASLETLSPADYANALEISERELAKALNVHCNLMRLHPEYEAIQNKLRPFAQAFELMLLLKPDQKSAAFHMKNTPIRVLGYKSVYEVLKDGEPDRALRYLQSISGGQNG